MKKTVIKSTELWSFICNNWIMFASETVLDTRLNFHYRAGLASTWFRVMLGEEKLYCGLSYGKAIEAYNFVVKVD